MRLTPTLLLQLPLLLVLACSDSGGNGKDSESPSNDDDTPVGDDTTDDDDINPVGDDTEEDDDDTTDGDDTANDDDDIEPRCGDGVLDAGEQCETGRGDINCSDECLWARKPFLALHRKLPTAATGLALLPGRSLVVALAGGLESYDVSNPGGILRVASIDDSGDIRALTATQGRVILARTYNYQAYDLDPEGLLVPGESVAYSRPDWVDLVPPWTMASDGQVVAGLHGDAVFVLDAGPPMRMAWRPDLFDTSLLRMGGLLVDQDQVYQCMSTLAVQLSLPGSTIINLQYSDNNLQLVGGSAWFEHGCGAMVKAAGFYWLLRNEPVGEADGVLPGIDRFSMPEDIEGGVSPPTIPLHEFGQDLATNGRFLYTSNKGLTATDVTDPALPLAVPLADLIDLPAEGYVFLPRLRGRWLKSDDQCAYLVGEDNTLMALCCLPGMCGTR